MITRTITTMMMLMILTSCHHSDDEETAHSSSHMSPSTPYLMMTDEEMVKSMQALKIPPGFDFNPISDHSLSVDISSLYTGRAFLTLYTGFEKIGESLFQVDYDSKIATSMLQQGAAVVDYQLANEYSVMLAEIWFYDGRSPIQQLVTVGQPQLTL